MSESPLSDTSLLCQGILQYLREHPEAADSLEGIASWWLPASAYSQPSEAVQRALERLVEEHRISRIHLADGRILYQSVEKVSGAHPAWTPRDPRG